MAGLQLGGELVWLLLAWVAGALVTVAAGVPLAQGRRVPAILSLAGPLVALGAAPCLAAWSLSGEDPRQGVDTAAVIRILAMLAAPVVVGWTGLFLGVAGLRERPRALGAAGAVVGVALVAAGLVLAGGIRADDRDFAIFRAALELVVGAVAMVAVVGMRGPVASSAAAGMGASALGFATVEAGMRGIASAVMGGQVAAMEPQFKVKAAQAFLDVAAMQAPWQVAGLAVWSVGAVTVAAVAARTARSAEPLAATVALPVAWAILLLGYPGVELLSRL